MNWVGGSRSRMMFKQERQKQREFFQKKKMKSKLKLLESSNPPEPLLSLDLLNLHVVNQISKKKEKSKHPHHVDICKRKDKFSDVRMNVQLPMSPVTVPSKICLDDSEIMSSHSKTLDCRTDRNPQYYITNQELKHEEMVDTTSDGESRNFLSESNKKQTRPQREPGFQHSLYDKFTSCKNNITLSQEKVKLPLQSSTSHLTNLRLFEMQADLPPNVSNLNKNGKCDMAD
ncbi:regulator of DNA class I crossover intermediates 1 [Anomaloglossus baeobatrachus]|uniref:regulator of DNA class I crossover intermediates 1 n=1 Tax=Anomaloglossus baeobatrachus TaxID=238106 RepID=UPI003F4FFF07